MNTVFKDGAISINDLIARVIIRPIYGMSITDNIDLKEIV